MVAAYTLMFCRITIALAFAISVFGKAQDITAFQEAISDFQILAPDWSKTAAWVFLCAETCGVLLMVIGGGLLLPGFLLAALLLLTFAVALVLVLLNKRRISCNCFGRSQRRISPYDVVRNLLLTACGLVGVWALVETQQALPAIDSLLIGLIATCFVVLVTNMADVIETLRHPFASF